MLSPLDVPAASRGERAFLAVLLLAALAFSAWAVSVGWASKRLPGVEFRQAQTALSTHFIARADDFSLAYPTPVLGRPWSVPMEAPLYQWSVVLTSRATGWNLTKAGRAVSIASFYAAVPAVFLLLGTFGVSRARRAIGLAVFLTCPFLLFYARAFLIETMALAAALWFAAALVRAVERRHAGWLALAVGAGGVAGLAKVTTLLLVLLPLAGWSAVRLWSQRRAGWAGDVARLALAVGVPLALAAAWVFYSDAVKAQNPLADFLSSENLRGFNLGTWATRFSPELWAMKWRIAAQELTAPWAAAGVAAVALVGAWRRLGAALGCAAVFGAALVVFPELYALHSYYFVANVAWLLLALGLALTALAGVVRWPLLAALTLGFVGAQVDTYFERYYDEQRVMASEGDPLSVALKLCTEPDDVLVVTGQDWNAMTPYYAERRALMLRSAELPRRERVVAAVGRLAQDRIGALVVAGDPAAQAWLVELLAARGLDPVPLFTFAGTTVYGRRERNAVSLGNLAQRFSAEVQLGPGRTWPSGPAEAPLPAGEWVELARLTRGQRMMFTGFSPEPVRVQAQFGFSANHASGRWEFSMHPTTRLVWALPAGRFVLRTVVFLRPEAFADSVPPADRTDGVQVQVRAVRPEGGPVFFTYLIDPYRRESDRGRLRLVIPFELAEAGEVEFSIGPGPQGRLDRDWCWLETLKIAPVNAPR